jgi:hypothetical protein
MTNYKPLVTISILLGALWLLPKNDKLSHTSASAATARPIAIPASEQPAEPIVWATDYKEAYAEAKKSEKLLLVHLVTDGCAPCNEMEYKVFPRVDVKRELRRFVLVKGNERGLPWRGSRLTWRQYTGASRFPFEMIVDPNNGPSGTWQYKGNAPSKAASYVTHLRRFGRSVVVNPPEKRSAKCKCVNCRCLNCQCGND